MCDVIIDAIERRVSHDRPVNLAFGERVTLLEVVSMLEDELGREVERCHGESRTGDVPHSQVDTSMLRRLFPDIVAHPLRSGISETVAWHRSQIPA